MAASEKDPPKRKATFWIDSDPQLQREFKAACALMGETVQDRFRTFMRQTVQEAFAGFRPGESA